MSEKEPDQLESWRQRTVRDAKKYPAHLEFVLQTWLFNGRFEVRRHEGIDHLMELLIGYAPDMPSNPQVCVRPSVHPRPDRVVDNVMKLDLDPQAGVGAIVCNMMAGDSPGSWWTHGSGHESTRTLRWDHHVKDESALPASAAVPLDAVRQAIHEFYDLKGAGLPGGVKWQRAPVEYW